MSDWILIDWSKIEGMTPDETLEHFEHGNIVIGYIDYHDGSCDYFLCLWSRGQNSFVRVPSASPITITHYHKIKGPGL